MLIFFAILGYFVLLLLVSRLATPKSDNDNFFRGHRRSRWPLVAFGMIGASISGVTFISVPGMVITQQMTYLQTCLGFILGYLLVAFILLPVYYKLGLTTIYSYLRQRFGPSSYKTGAGFFLLSKMTGAAVRFFVVCFLLQHYLLDAYGVPFPLTVVVMVGLIWLYSRRGGIQTLVWTDTLQTFCMLTALVLILLAVMEQLHLSPAEAVAAIADDPHSRIFVMDDWMSTQNFWKQFVSGAFIVVVMTGLDQDMMQKNLTCRTLRDAQRDMCSYGLAFVPVNLLFLCLGVLLLHLAQREGIAWPEQTDNLLPMFAATGQLGRAVVVFFTVGVVAAGFSSADSALTALTTSYCVDIRERDDDERLRRRAHLTLAFIFALCVIVFGYIQSTNVLDAIFTLCSYTYGPLLGLFAYGLFTHRSTCDRMVPYVAIASPVVCFIVERVVGAMTGYHFGYESLLLNGCLTFLGLWIMGKSDTNC